MKAIIQRVYGPPEALQLKDIDRPTIRDDEVLVHVRAAALHIGDCFAVRGSPLPMRMVTGVFRPNRQTPGFDVAGLVEEVGRNVSAFAVNDAVFGVCNGACAEYASASSRTLARLPDRLTFEQAAALPTSGLAALHGLRDAGKLQAGQQVLINGAAGGIGSFAVQIAKAFGAEVTGVCGPSNVALVHSLGADHVIDYTQQDFTDGGQQFDLILDNVENRSLAACRRVLKDSGTLVLNSGTGSRGLKTVTRLVHPLMLSPLVRQNLRRFLSRPNAPDLLILTGLVEAGKLKPIIGATHSLSDVPRALRHIEGGHARGKVVITIPE